MKTKFLLSLTLAVTFAFTSCISKRLYYACVNSRRNIQAHNQDLIIENNSAKSENEKLKKENTNIKQTDDSLRTENQRLRNELEAQTRKTKKFDLYFRQLCCDKTTEQGADEVYITVLGSKIGSSDVFLRVPGNSAHWDMNDGNQPIDNPTGDSHCLTNRTLFSGELKPGEIYFINVAVCEEDGGTTRKYEEYAAQAAIKSGDPYAVAAGVFVSILASFGLYKADTDDWMGMFGVRIKNNDGDIIVEWRSKEGIVHLIEDANSPNNPMTKAIRMNHDGSNYIGWFGVRYN